MKPEHEKEREHEIKRARKETERTEGSIHPNPVSAIHPAGCLLDKAPDLPLIALSATIEVLAGEFGDPNLASARVVIEVGDILLEVWESNVVPMEADNSGLDVDAVEELLDPNKAVGCRGGSGGTKNGVALGSKGANVLVPHVDAVLDAYI